MDQKTWLWRKKSTEKIILATEKLNISQKDNGDETLVADKGEVENELKIFKIKLSSALSDCKTKDELVKKHEKMELEAVEGREKAEAEAVSLKQELGEALRQRAASEERLTHLDVALKECMHQLRFIREEQEKRIHDALMKASKEFEESQKILEDQLAETSKRLSKLGVENTNLSKALLAKEKVVDELNRQRAQMEIDFNALMARLESTEKDNTSLKYEVRVLEKELEIRSEEREFNRRTAEASQKQQLESVKKIAMLESECQRLRLLVRKRLPGPAALVKMKNEVEMLGGGSVEIVRRKLNPSPTRRGLDYAVDNYSDSPGKRINILTDQVCAMEEENKSLKEALNKKTSELQFSRVVYARTASKLSEVESQLEESTKSRANNDSTRNSVMSHEISLASVSDVGSDDKASCAESWASALISELEHVRNGQLRKSSSHKTVGSSEINLMDDFVEMEKLALVSVDKVSESSKVPSDEAKGDADVNICLKEKSNQQFHPDLSKSICRIIELIEGISLPSPDYIIPESLSEKKKSNTFSYKHSETPSGYTARVFQWKTSELSAVLQQFVHACYDLFNGKTEINKFIQELASALDWIINHCFSLQDVSSMRDAIKKHFDWDESRSESEAEVGVFGQYAETDKLHIAAQEEPNVREESRKLRDESKNIEAAKKHLDKLQSSSNRSASLLNQLDESEKMIMNLQVELDTLRKTEKMVEGRVEKHKPINENLDTQFSLTKVELNEACKKFPSQDLYLENRNINCHEELEATCLDNDSVSEKEISSSEVKWVGNQFRTNREITAASEKLAECQETIFNLGKQLKALASPKEAALFDKVIVSTPTNYTSTSTSSCTIPTPPKKLISQRSSLLDQMIAEDNAETNHLESPHKANEKGDPSSSTISNRTTAPPLHSILVLNGNKHQEDGDAVTSSAIIAIKKEGGSLWKKLLWRKKKGNNSKKTPLPFAMQAST